MKEYFARLRWPRYSPPLIVWYAIGGLYYAVFGYVLYRVLRSESASVFRPIALVLIGSIMILNGLWNLLFFRAQNLYLSLLATGLAPLFDLVLLVLVIPLDRQAVWALVPYLIYRAYSVWWIYGLGKLNRPR